MKTPETTDVVIVGGGVIGLSVARALSSRGVKDVMLIERATLGAESSAAAAGMLAPQAEADCADAFFTLCCRSRDMYPKFAAELLEETAIDIELDTTGTLYLAFSERDEEEIGRRFDWQARAALDVVKLSAEDARRLEPSISETVRAGLRFSRDTQIENRLLLAALAKSNLQRKVAVRLNTAVRSVRTSRGKVEGIETARGFVSTRNVVIASGAWTSLIETGVSLTPLVEPIRGQMICLQTQSNLFRHVIYSPRGYLVPRMDGRLLAGSTSEHVGFDKSVTAFGVYSLLGHALEMSPTISSLSLVDSWAGLRPRSLDGLPLLGPSPEIEGLVYATGHYRNGILLAPVTGELTAGVIADQSVSPLMEAFFANRFYPVSVS